MISIVQNVEQVRIEGMNIIDLGKVCKNGIEFFIERILGELYFAHVKRTDTRDLVSFVDYGGSLALCLGKDNIDKLSVCWHRLNLFEIVPIAPLATRELDEDMAKFCTRPLSKQPSMGLIFGKK